MLGLAQAFGMPAALSIAADHFSKQQGLVVAVLSVGGSQLGSGCATLSILLAGLVGWRWAVLFFAFIGIALVPVLLFTIPEPPRTEWSAPCPLDVVYEEVFEKSRVSRMLIAASSAKLLAAYSLSAFLPVYYARSNLEGYSSSAFVAWNASAVCISGIFSAALGYFISEHWKRVDVKAPCYIGLIGAIASIPIACGVLLATNFYQSMLFYVLLQLVGEAWFGPTISLLQASVRRSVRGQAVSMALVAVTLIANLGPALVGFVSLNADHMWVHLMWMVLMANVVAAFAFLWTAREIGVDPIAAGFGSKADFGEPLPSARPAATHWAAF